MFSYRTWYDIACMLHCNASHAVRAMRHSIATNNKVTFVLLQLKDFICCCCNNNNRNMDVESYRNQKVKYFVESIGMVYCSKWKEFTYYIICEIIAVKNTQPIISYRIS